MSIEKLRVYTYNHFLFFLVQHIITLLFLISRRCVMHTKNRKNWANITVIGDYQTSQLTAMVVCAHVCHFYTK